MSVFNSGDIPLPNPRIQVAICHSRAIDHVGDFELIANSSMSTILRRPAGDWKIMNGIKLVMRVRAELRIAIREQDQVTGEFNEDRVPLNSTPKNEL